MKFRIGLAASLLAINAGAQIVLWSCNFTNDDWLTGWDNTNDAPKKGIAFGSTNIVRISDATAPGGAFLRITFPAGSDAPSDGPPIGGTQFYGAMLHTNGNQPLDAAILKFSVRFPTNFDFVKGGKLPGFYGGTGNTGTGESNLPDGEDGFTTRFMWRTGGAGEAYPFLPTSPTSGGTELGKGNWNFAADNQWHTLQQKCVLNDIGASNGVIQVWYDGEMVLNAGNLFFRSTNSLKIDGVIFQTFFGGNGADWSTPITTYADFANFSVSSTNNPPQLSVALAGTDVILSWPADGASGFILESSTTLFPADGWNFVSNGSLVGNQFKVTNLISSSSCFYRLRHP
ncbi:MAG TPA: hypothetical protein VHG71_13240 [Verrucomicrobiae bacterium]|nr:hypothetical protein [Verrucomicrobiae bacterium]